jgi:hypothetical protein
MRRTTTLITGTLTALLTAAAVSGCSSSGTSDDANSPTPGGSKSSAPSVTAAPTTKAANGHLEYTGKSTGSADFTSAVACEIKAGKLFGVTAPDPADKKAPKAPLFIATAGGLEKLAMLVTPDNKSYSQRASGTVAGHRTGGGWTVTVQNLKIADEHGGATDEITVNGSLTCTSTT